MARYRFGYVKRDVVVVDEISKNDRAAALCREDVHGLRALQLGAVHRKVETALAVDGLYALERLQDIDVMYRGEDVLYEPVYALALKHGVGFVVEEADDLGVLARDAPDGGAEDEIGKQVVPHDEKALFSDRGVADPVDGPGFVENKEKQGDVQVFRLPDDRDLAADYAVALDLDLAERLVDLSDPVDVKRYRRQRSVADDLIARNKALLVAIRRPYLADRPVQEAAGVRYRIVEFPAPDDDVHDALLDALLVVVRLQADLLETGAFYVHAFYVDAHLLGVDRPRIVELPSRSRKRVLWFQNSSDTVIAFVHFTHRFWPY